VQKEEKWRDHDAKHADQIEDKEQPAPIGSPGLAVYP